MIKTLLLAAILAAPAPAQAAQLAPAQAAQLAPAPLADLVAKISIPYEQFRLNNGLTVVVHTDRKAPLVSVGVWYLVGARDEPVGRSGFAHLFEHLMFRGSEHSRQDHFRPLEEAGGTQLNGTTDFDRTNYYQTVPTPALDLALFLESDRMGWLLPALTQAVLDSERGIVLNEKAQGENQPGGLVHTALFAALFPADHPYGVSAIGQAPDLKAATLDDTKGWFRENYGPNNAVLVLAGDTDAATARPMVERWFGQIAPGPTPARFKAATVSRPATTRETLTDKVATARLIRAWALPASDAPLLADLDVGLATLGDGPTSLLYDRLVRQERLAVGVSAGASFWQGAGIASISIDVRPGVDPALAEARADALLAQWMREGPSADELTRITTRVVGSSIRSLEQVGGGGGKGAALAEGALFHQDPGRYKQDLADIAAATPESVRAAARTYLSSGDHRITLLPGERNPTSIAVRQSPRTVSTPRTPATGFVAQGTPANRSRHPVPAGETRLTTPAIERARLANGLAVTLVRNDAVPVVRLQLSFPTGIPADSRAKPGTQRMMLALLREGSNGALGQLDGPEIARRSERLGLSFAAAAGLDATRLSLSALSVNLAPSLQLYADMLRHPTFDASQLNRVRGQILASLDAEAVSPNGIATRAAPPLIYGPDHPYGFSFTGNGTSEGVTAITRDDLLAFHRATFHPSQASLFIVGDKSIAEMQPLLEATLGNWQTSPAAHMAISVMPAARPQAAGRIILYDRPNSPQSVILAAAPLPLTGRDDTLPLSLANDAFGGSFTARLNKLLREEKNWTYGAQTSISATRHDMPFMLSAPVETPRTGDSIAAIRTLLSQWHGSHPVTQEELDRARAALIRALPGDFETGGAMLGALERAHLLGRPDDYLDTLPARAAAVTLKAAQSAPIPRADALTYIIVGDRTLVEPQLKSLNLPYEVRPTAASKTPPTPGTEGPGARQ